MKKTGFNIPTIEDLAMSAHRDLIEKKRELVYFKNKHPSYKRRRSPQYCMIHSKELEIEELEKMLIEYKQTIRIEKLKELGI
jgi:hypothetical protein